MAPATIIVAVIFFRQWTQTGLTTFIPLYFVTHLGEPAAVGNELLSVLLFGSVVGTLLGGNDDGWLAGPLFYEPAGLSFAGDKLYVADTNAHRIRVVDVKTKKVSTLRLTGVEPWT